MSDDARGSDPGTADGGAARAVRVAIPVPLDSLFSYLVPEELPTPAPGTRVIVPFGRRTLTGVVIAHGAGAEAPAELKTISRVLDDEPLVDEDYLDLARWMATVYCTTLGEAVSAMLPSGRREKALPELSGEEPLESPEAITLSEEQRAAIDAVQRPGEPGEEAWYYLYGITGSGKTEVFLRLAEREIAAGRSVIYLVPEIALTHQLFEHISRRFGEAAAMLHSGITPAERFGQWMRIKRGEARLVVGARSAVFAPVRHLGLVVIDEEHEGSYKAGNAPRYHARQVAMRRTLSEGAACVMGSATPSVEAWHLMAGGRLRRLTLSRRLSGGALPHLTLFNLRTTHSLISPPLIDSIRESHRRGAQSILFLNRRGYAGTFQCRACGYQMECPHCSVPMTYHKANNRMVCHYCGRTAQPISVCPQCKSLDVGFFSFGTERVEEEMGRLFPHLTVERLDTDVTRKRGALREILSRFAAGEIDVLLGTQMVAKGLNFPGVRTVGIISADIGLSLPDFRAAERSFALIVQVAGRAGRFRTDGEVIVQTLRPEHPAIRHAVHHRMEEFYREELAVRRELGFPPFSRLVRLVVRGGDRDVVESVSDRLADEARRSSVEVEVLGPAPALLERISRNWRFQILLRGTSQGSVVALSRRVLDLHRTLREARKTHLEVDVDPVQLL